MSLLQRLQRFRAPAPLADALWYRALQACPLASRLATPEQSALRTQAAVFLADKRFHPVRGARLDAHRCLLIAIQACTVVRHLGRRPLRGWRDIIVYPGEFLVPRSHRDAATGVVHEGADALIGEAWESGPLILSWAAVQADLEHPFDGFHLIAHELAHKLDMLDGPANGVPALPARLPRRQWITTFQAAYDRLARDVDAGRHTLIDPYAAEGADEYFAVASEMHLSDPDTLSRAEPAVAALLEDFYGPSPASRR